MEKSTKQRIAIYILRAVLIVLILCWMNMIFGFSADTGDESRSLSDIIVEHIIRFFVKDYDSLDIYAKTEAFNRISHIVRKIGHFGEYGILGVLFSSLLLTFGIRGFKLILSATLICLLYAVTDEVHQVFVDGRSGQISDVVLDGFGGMTGALFTQICTLIWRKIYGKFQR